MNSRTAIVVTTVTLLISLILYFALGGFNPIEYSLIQNEKYKIIGKEYTGVNNSSTLENIFTETKELLKNDFDGGTLIIVNDDEKYDDEFNQVGYFIGILVRSATDSTPAGYVLKEYEAARAIRARINSHNLVMPRPDKVRQGAIEFSERERAEMSNYSFEKYFEDGSIEVDFPLIK